MAAVRVQSILKNLHDINVPLALFIEGKTIREIAQHIEQLRAPPEQTPTTEKESVASYSKADNKGDGSEQDSFWKTEVESLWRTIEAQFSSISELRLASANDAAAMHILLTGASGFIGTHLLRDLLQTTADTTRIHCLVRPSSEDKLLSEYMDLWELSDEDRDRIVVVRGDLSQPLLGLTQAKFDELSAVIDVIFHNGAMVNFAMPYASHKAANVLGTVAILQLATTTKVKTIHYVSTAGILNSSIYSSENIELKHIRPSDIDQMGGYTQSKYVAERLVQRARENGLPCSIFRPGIVSPCSLTGHPNLHDWVMRFVCGSIQLGFYPRVNGDIDLVPVDYVSQSIVLIAMKLRDQAITTPAFHLVNPHRRTKVNDIFAAIREFGFNVQHIPEFKWIDLVQDDAVVKEDNLLYLLRPLFESQFPTSSPHSKWDSSNTARALQEHFGGVPYTTLGFFSRSNLDIEYWKRCFAYLVKKRILPRP